MGLSVRPPLKSVLFLFVFLLDSPSRAAEQGRETLVQWVIDGDTFQTSSGERVRLLGINSPENQPWNTRVDFYGPEASAYAKKLLNGKKVRLEGDIEPKDRYGRTLAYVYRAEDDLFVNEHLVAEGYAESKHYRQGLLHQKELDAAEKKARAAKAGMWSKKK